MEERINSIFEKEYTVPYWKISHNPKDIDLPGATANEWRCDSCHLTFGVNGPNRVTPVCPVCDNWAMVRVHSVRVPWEVMLNIIGVDARRRLERMRSVG